MSSIPEFTEYHTNSDHMYSASPRFFNIFHLSIPFASSLATYGSCIKFGLRCFIPRISLERHTLDKSSGSFNWFCICSPSLADLRFDLFSFASLTCFLPTAVGFHYIPRSTEQCHSTGVLGFYFLALSISSCGSITENRQKVSTTAGLTIRTCRRSWRPRKHND